MSVQEKTNFLVAYNYGTGGLWCVISARSAEEILAKYPELSVVETRPLWMKDDYFRKISAPDRLIDIDGEPTGWLLTAVVADWAS
jgi:hypothetical protein